MPGLNNIKVKTLNFFQDRRAWVKSLFCYKHISRKYDEHFYFRGRLYSKYHWHQEMTMFFGVNYAEELNKYKPESQAIKQSK